MACNLLFRRTANNFLNILLFIPRTGKWYFHSEYTHILTWGLKWKCCSSKSEKWTWKVNEDILQGEHELSCIIIFLQNLSQCDNAQQNIGPIVCLGTEKMLRGAKANVDPSASSAFGKTVYKRKIQSKQSKIKVCTSGSRNFGRMFEYLQTKCIEWNSDIWIDAGNI